MQEPTFSVSCLSVVTLSTVLLIFSTKPRWMPAIGSVGSALVLFGAIRFDYFHQPNAKYLFFIPGILLMGISVLLMIRKTVIQWKRERV